LAVISAIGLSLLGTYIAGFGVLNETLLRVGVFTLAAIVMILNGAAQRFDQNMKAPE
jgi:hypothetical protein